MFQHVDQSLLRLLVILRNRLIIVFFTLFLPGFPLSLSFSLLICSLDLYWRLLFRQPNCLIGGMELSIFMALGSDHLRLKSVATVLLGAGFLRFKLLAGLPFGFAKLFLNALFRRGTILLHHVHLLIG